MTKRGKKHIIRGSHYNSGQKDLVFANGLSQAISDPNCVSLTTGTTFVCLFKLAEYLVTFFSLYLQVLFTTVQFSTIAVLDFKDTQGKGLARESLE